MRILLIHNYYQKAGGEDTVFKAEGELLAQNGHTVERLIFDNKLIKSFRDIINFGLSSIYNAKSAKILKAKIQEFQPDLIHVHNFFPIASPSIFFTAHRLKVPVVFTLHNYRLICPSGILFYDNKIYEKSIHHLFPIDAIRKGIYRNSKLQTAAVVMMTGLHKLINTWNRKIDAFITLSEFSKNIFINSSLKVKPDKLFIKPNFVFDNGFDTDKEDYFFFVGRLVPEKGIMTVIKAFEQIPDKLKIVGVGPLDDEVKTRIASSKNIEYLGYQFNEDVLKMLKKAKALIFASSWYETFGMTIIEAFSTATPVIVSKLGGHGELVENGKTGFHFQTNNAEDLICQIQKMQNVELNKEMGLNAREVFLQKYTPQINYEILMGIYQTVIDAKTKK